MLRESDFPLPTEFDKAYAASDILVFETDIGQLESLQTQQMILSKAMYTDGSTVDKHLKPETYQLLQEHCAANGIPLAAIKVFKPSMIAITLTVMELMKVGMTQDGVDQRFYRRGVNDEKPIDYFESIEQQVEYIAGMGQGNEDAYIVHTIKNVKNTGQLIDDLVAAWKNGDAGKLDTLMTEELKNTANLYEQLIVERNNNWMPKIREFQATPEKEYILVGVGHLVGSDGILKMLADDGYRITQL